MIQKETKKEKFMPIIAIAAVSVCFIAMVFIFTGSLSILAGIFNKKAIYVVGGIVILLIGIYWKRIKGCQTKHNRKN